VAKRLTPPYGFTKAQHSKAQDPIVSIVDDDDGVREAVASLFRSVGLETQEFRSAVEVLQRRLPDVPGCLVLDIRMPGLSGLDLQLELAKANIDIPIVFMTGHADVPMTVKAMKGGAIDLLTKPFRDQDMLDSVWTAIARDRTRREADKAIASVQAHFGSLTNREREVFAMVTSGLMNKQVAARIGIAEITVKLCRGRIMKKMGAKSLAELVRMVDTIALRAAKPAPVASHVQLPDDSMGRTLSVATE